MGVRNAARKWMEKVFSQDESYLSRTLAKNKLVPCNKDLNFYLSGYEVPYVMESLSRAILIRADTPFVFRESGRSSMRRVIGDHFLRKGRLPPEVADDVHEACALYKRWLQTLREPLVPLRIQLRIAERLSALDSPEEWQLQRLAELMASETDAHIHLQMVCFVHCISMLQQVALHKDKNFMSSEALAAIFVGDLFVCDIFQSQTRAVSHGHVVSGSVDERVLRNLILFLDYLISGRGNRILVKALRRNLYKDNLAEPRPVPQFGYYESTLPPIPVEARAALDRSNDPILLLWRTHDFDAVPAVEERSPLRITFLRNRYGAAPGHP